MVALANQSCPVSEYGDGFEMKFYVDVLRNIVIITSLMHMNRLWVVAALNCVGRLMSIFAPLLLLRSLSSDADQLHLLTAIGLMFLLFFASTAISALLAYQLTNMKATMYAELSQRFSTYVFNQPARHSAQVNSHDVMRHIEQLQTVSFEVAHHFHNNILPNAIMYVVAAGVSYFVFGAWASVLMIFSVMLYFGSVWVFVPKSRRITSKLIKNEAFTKRFIFDLISHNFAFKAAASAERVLRVLDSRLHQYQAISRAVSNVFVSRNLFIELAKYVSVFGIMLVLFWSNQFAAGGIAVGLLAFYIVAMRLFEPVDGLVKSTFEIAKVQGELAAAIDLLKSTSQRKVINNYRIIAHSLVRPSDLVVALKKPEVRFGSSAIKLNTDIAMSFGDVVLFHGPNGIGKSTIARAVANLDELASGTIETNRTVRVGYASQETQLIQGTVQRNILLYRPMRSNRRLQDLCLNLGISEQTFHGGSIDVLDFQVADRGTNLSLGQRSRVLIARAMFDPPDILILDELLSAVDDQSFKPIIEYIKGQVAILILVDHGGRASSLCSKSIDFASMDQRTATSLQSIENPAKDSGSSQRQVS